MKNKLPLNELRINSFVTSLDDKQLQTVQGGVVRPGMNPDEEDRSSGVCLVGATIGLVYVTYNFLDGYIEGVTEAATEN